MYQIFQIFLTLLPGTERTVRVTLQHLPSVSRANRLQLATSTAMFYLFGVTCLH